MQVRLAIENQDDFHIANLIEFICSVEARYLGFCLDSTNSLRVGEDPILILERADLDNVFMVQTKEII